MVRAGFLLPDLRGGGAERAALRLLRHWPGEAERPALIVRRLQGAYADEAHGLDVHELGVATTGPAASVATARGVARLARALDLDVLVTFLSVASAVAAKLLAPGLRVVWSVQTPVGRDGVTVSGPGSWRAGILGLLSRALLPLIDGVVLPARGLGLTLPLRCYRGEIAVVPNPVDLPTADRAAQDRQVPALVAVGRLVPLKRVELLVEAVALVNRHRPVTLSVYGEGPERARLQALVEEAGLTDRVHLHGFANDLDRVYGAADAFVHAAEYEGFGNVIVEAMAYGLPCVVTDAPFGPPDIVDGGRYGVLVPRGDAEALAAAIERVLPGGPDRARLQAAALARAAEYAGPAVARQLHDVLARLVAGAPAKAELQ